MISNLTSDKGRDPNPRGKGWAEYQSVSFTRGGLHFVLYILTLFIIVPFTQRTLFASMTLTVLRIGLYA